VKRRLFFKRLAQAVGLIALAPQLAFKAPSFESEISLKYRPLTDYWVETTRVSRSYDAGYMLAMKALRAGARFEDFESIP
jgi:hypothetical protein